MAEFAVIGGLRADGIGGDMRSWKPLPGTAPFVGISPRGTVPARVGRGGGGAPLEVVMPIAEAL